MILSQLCHAIFRVVQLRFVIIGIFFQLTAWKKACVQINNSRHIWKILVMCVKQNCWIVGWLYFTRVFIIYVNYFSRAIVHGLQSVLPMHFVWKSDLKSCFEILASNPIAKPICQKLFRCCCCMLKPLFDQQSKTMCKHCCSSSSSANCLENRALASFLQQPSYYAQHPDGAYENFSSIV